MSLTRWAGGLLSDFQEGASRGERARQAETARRQAEETRRLERERSLSRIQEGQAAREGIVWQAGQVANVTNDTKNQDVTRGITFANGVEPALTKHKTATINADGDVRMRILGAVGDQAAQNREAILGADPSSNFSRYMDYLQKRDSMNMDLIQQQMPTQGQQMFNNLLTAGALALAAFS